MAADALGITLAHEHVLVDFIGADRVSPSRYDRDAAFAKALPHLERLARLGCRTLVECTPAYLGRDPVLLQRLSRAASLQILTNTGYYGAANDKFLPPHAFTESADQLAARWIREARDGIDGTGVMPAFMKIGVDAGPLSAVDEKLVRAAARTHRATGLPIYSHTGNGIAALAEVAVLDDERAPLGAFVWVHAQNETDPAVHVQVARRGAWVSFDGVAPQSLERHVGLRAGDARGPRARSRPGLARCRLVPRRRARRRHVSAARSDLHGLPAGLARARPERRRDLAADGRQSAEGADGRGPRRTGD